MNKKITIVGSGPAGAYLAYNLAINNLEVLLLEKESWPRYKACGGALSEKSLKLLADNNIRLREDIIKSRVKRFVFRFDYTSVYQTEYNGKDFKLVDRKKFDDYLLKKAVEAGVDFRAENEIKSIKEKDGKIILTADSGKYSSDIIIGADGANSLTASAFNAYPDNILQYKGTALESEIYHNKDKYNDKNYQKYIDENNIIIDFGQLANGYAWVFPKDNQLSVGLGNLKFMKSSLKSKFFEYLDRLKLTYQPEDIFLKGHPIPCYSKDAEIKRAGENYILIGDAAYLADAFIGEGIFYALKSAELASESLLEHLENKSELTVYNQKIEDELGSELAAAERLAHIFYNQQNLVKKVISVRPDLLKEFLDAVQGRSSYQELSNVFNFIKKILKL